MLVSLPPPVTPCFFFFQPNPSSVTLTKPSCLKFIKAPPNLTAPTSSTSQRKPLSPHLPPKPKQPQEEAGALPWQRKCSAGYIEPKVPWGGGGLLKVNGSPPRLARRGMPCLHGSSCFYCAHIPVDMQGSEPEGTPFASSWRGWLCWWAQQSEIQPRGKGREAKGAKTWAGLSSLPAVLMSCR